MFFIKLFYILMFFIKIFFKFLFLPIKVFFTLIERLLKKPIIIKKNNIKFFFLFFLIFILRFPYFLYFFFRSFIFSYSYEIFWEILILKGYLKDEINGFLIYLQKNVHNLYFFSPRKIFILIFIFISLFYIFCFIYATFTSKVIEIHHADEPYNENFLDSSRHQVINLFLRDFFLELLEMDYEVLNDRFNNVSNIKIFFPSYDSLNAVDLIQKITLNLHIYEEIDLETQSLLFIVLSQYEKEFFFYLITHSFFFFFILFNIGLCIYVYFNMFLSFLDYLLEKFYNPMISLYISGYFNGSDQYSKSKKLGRFIGYYIFIILYSFHFYFFFFAFLFIFNNVSINFFADFNNYYIVHTNYYPWHFWPFMEKIEVLENIENKQLYEVDKVLIDNSFSNIHNIIKNIITKPQLSLNNINGIEIINNEPCAIVDFYDFNIIKGNPLFSNIYQYYENAYNLLLNSKLDAYNSLPYDYDFIGHKNSFLHLNHQLKIYKEGETIPIPFSLKEISPGVFIEFNLNVQFFKEEVPDSIWIANSDFNTENILNELIFRNPNKIYIFKTLDFHVDLLRYLYFDKMLLNLNNMNVRSTMSYFLENNKKNLNDNSCENNMKNFSSIIDSKSDNNNDSINTFKCVCSEVSDTISEKIKEQKDCDCCLCPFCFFNFPNYISVMFFCVYYIPIIELLVNPNMFFYHFGYGVAFSFYYPLYKIFIPYIFTPLKYYFYHFISRYIWAGTFITAHISIRVVISAVGNTGEYTGGYVFILDP